MRKSPFLCIPIMVSAILIAMGCNSQGNSGSGVGSAKNKASTFKEGKDFTEFVRARVLDRVGFSEPVEAMSVLVPTGWTMQSEIMWNQPGSICAGNNMGMKATSPDGKYSFEMMPNFMWSFINDPQLAQFSQQQQYPKYCAWGEPMNAEAYFKKVFATNELGNPQVISIKESNSGVQALKENGEKARQELMRYGASQVNFFPSGVNATVKWNNGAEAIVLCGVTIIETTIPNNYTGTYSKSYTSVASERVVMMFPAGEYEQAARILSVIMGSFRTNMAWRSSVDNFWRGVREQSNRDHIGRIALMDQQTNQMGKDAIAKGNANLKAMDANIRSWEVTQQSQDRIHTNFVKSIREVENYHDETGTIELASSYNHAWSKSDGSSFIMSDNPNFDPSSVFQDQRWKEMKKVQ